MKILFKSVAGYFIISLLMNDVNGIMASLAQNANSLENLRYSRSFEKEADISGFEMLRQNHVDPHGMISLFQLLKNHEKVDMPGFLSTHPVTQDRIDYLTAKIKKELPTSRHRKHCYFFCKQKGHTPQWSLLNLL